MTAKEAVSEKSRFICERNKAREVINGPVANHTSKNFLPEPEQRQNELRGRWDEMDAGKTIEAIGIDTPTPTMGEVDRAEGGSGQTQISAKLL